MIILQKELRQGRWSLLIWTGILVFMLSVNILLYPMLQSQMEKLTESFEEMGELSSAFGAEAVSFRNFSDYFAMEYSNVMGLVGVLFAALLGIRSLASEEGEHTAEFLLTHPVTRRRVAGEKLLALGLQILIFHLVISGVCLGLSALIGEAVSVGRFLLFFFGCFLMHLEIAAVTFGLSAFLHRNLTALGIGVGAGAYLLNLLSNLVEELHFLRYITPLSYADSSVLTQGTLEGSYVAAGMGILVLSAAAGLWQYSRKEIA